MSIMTSHMAFPACDPTKINGKYVPASASHKMIMELLKGEMGFKGVVVTDAVKMLGLCTMFGTLEDVYVAALKAGNDTILGVNANYIDVIEAAVNKGEISEERINDACQRVLDMKEKLGLFDEPTYHNTDDITTLNAIAATLNKQVAEKAITLDVNRAGLFPLKKPIKNVHIVTICSDPAFEKQIRKGLPWRCFQLSREQWSIWKLVWGSRYSISSAPGKCFAVAATPTDWQPSISARASRVIRSGSSVYRRP